jgi:hypothetical protein
MIRRPAFPCLLALSTLLPALGAGAEGPPNLTGSWKENASLSQAWQEKFDLAFGRKPTGTLDQEVRLFWERAREVMAEAREVDIEQTAAEVKISAGETVRIFYFGRTHRRQTPQGLDVQAACRLDADALVIEEKVDKLTLVETLALRPDGRLGYTTRLAGPPLKEPFMVSRIYDRDR